MLILARTVNVFCVLLLNIYPGEFTTYSNVLYTVNSLLFLLPCVQCSCNILSRSQSVKVCKHPLLKLI